MIQKSLPTDEELSAYIDGELSVQDQARVAKAIARDPELAAHVAELTAMKHLMHDTFAQAPPEPYMEMRGRRTTLRDWGGRLSVWFALAALCGMATAAVFAYLVVNEAPTAKTSWRLAADKMHRKWAKKSVPRPRGRIRPEWIDVGVRAPDLSAAGVTLTAIDQVKLGKAVEAVRFGYIGHDGCKISLFVVDQRAPQRQPKLQWPDQTRAAEWTTSALRFVLVSRDKDHGHFDAMTRILGAWSPNAADIRFRRKAEAGVLQQHS